jgi:CRISPR-associated endonuclease/helicase Cas3
MQYKHTVDPMTKVEFVAHRREKDGQIQDLWAHLKEVSTLTGEFASVIGLEKQGKLIGLLHDIGKASSESDRYIRSATGLINSDEDDYVDFAKMKGKIDHASAGAQVLYRYFSDKGNVGLLTMQILSLAIASHHSGLIDCLAPDGNNTYIKRMEKADEKTRYKECISNLDSDIKQEIDALLSDDLLVNLLNQKLPSLAEECDENDTRLFKLGLLTRFLFSCLIDADRLNTADFEFPEEAKQRNLGNYESWPVLIEKLENRLKKFGCRNNVDKLRQDISNSCLKFSTKPKGLYQLSVSTGGGKTLASLRFAINHAKQHKMDRVIYFIPYTSIIDQNAQTVREIFEEKLESGIYSNDIVLEHHSNLTPEEENTKQRLLSDNWDAPVVFTTMVQFLEAFFGSGTRSARRMHQLANAVIIFDEIQTLPIRCVHLFNVATRFLTQGCGSTVVLCTATQPLLGEVLPVQRALRLTPGQQMMPNVEELFKELKRVEVYDRRKQGGWTDSEVAELTERELEETGSVLIVLNTKKSAKSLFQQFLNHPNAEVYHLSTDMCPAHRMEIFARIKACLSENKPIICVSTQLIEAGVDIDFGTVIRYLAGLDSIAQAAGRCNRNGARSKLGRVFVVNPQEENLDKLEDIRKGRDSAERVLEEYKEDPKQFGEDILSPKALERYYKYYFYDRSDLMNYPIGSKSVVGRDDNLFELLSTNNLSLGAYQRQNQQSSPQFFLRQSFKTAAKAFQSIDSPTRGVIVPYGKEGERIINELCAAQYLGKQYRLLKEAQRYSVNVFPYMFNKLIEQKVIREIQKDTGVFYLDKHHYSKYYGMSESPVQAMEFLIVEEVCHGKQS